MQQAEDGIILPPVSYTHLIGPFEVENVLIQHDAVLECAITGVPDEERGYVVKATIVLQKGFIPSDEMVKELQTFVKENTAPYKYPRIVEFVDQLPKTISGKIRHEAIRRKSANPDNKDTNADDNKVPELEIAGQKK